VRPSRILAALAIGASLAVAACGDDEATTPASTPTVTVPEFSTTSSTTSSTSTTTSTQTTTTETTTTSTTSTSEPDDDTGGVSPDDSGEDAFDEFCDENPEACE